MMVMVPSIRRVFPGFPLETSILKFQVVWLLATLVEQVGNLICNSVMPSLIAIFGRGEGREREGGSEGREVEGRERE